MGIVKNEMLEVEDRGWCEPEGYVCCECVEDHFLKEMIRHNACQNQCDYCGRISSSEFAAPVAMLMEAIASAVFYKFSEPTRAGVPYDGGLVIKSKNTRDVLMSLPLRCQDQLFEEIAESFIYDSWVPSAGGHWASSHPSDALNASWASFVTSIKHEVRYFFSRLSSNSDPEEFDPEQLLSVIGHLVIELSLIRIIQEHSSFFRVRERDPEATWELNQEQMGPPPVGRAAAGRMNPAGISYMYLALEEETALAEVINGPPCGAAIARFETVRPITVLDLTSLPPLPSVFDDSRREEREGLLFLHQFVREISKPIKKDGREHIDYVPSQVVSEYFALVTQGNGPSLDGIVYPSAVRPGGKNIVLFPDRRRFTRVFNQVEFHSAHERYFATWAELAFAVTTIHE